MKRQGIWIGIGLAALAVLAAIVMLRPGEPETSPEAEQAARAPEVEQPAPAPEVGAQAPSTRPSSAAELKLLPAEIRSQVESALSDAGAQNIRVAALDAQMARGRNNLQWLFTPPASNAPDWQKEGWDRYMAPLMYPEGHPVAGQWRDSVSVADVQAAAVPFAEPFFPPEYLDQPMLHVPEKRINFNDLNQAAARLWNREDPGATAGPFYDWLRAAPEDPDAYASDFWLPAPAGHPDATSHREWLSEEIARQVEQQIEEQRAQRGS